MQRSISIHAPRVGRDRTARRWNTDGEISIHAPRVGRDCRHGRQTVRRVIFQSTRPVWGATTRRHLLAHIGAHFNPRAPCGARQCGRQSARQRHRISIHAPRVGRDNVLAALPDGTEVISIHAPRVGRDSHQTFLISRLRKFQSTRPVWGATAAADKSATFRHYFNPRAPCGARPGRHGGGILMAKFQSTRPVWGATRPHGFVKNIPNHFNPRAPCGARRFA